MAGGKRNSQMLIPTIVMAVIALVLVQIGFSRGQGQHVEGLKSAGGLALEVLPLLLFAFVVAGMVQALLPPRALENWIGAGAGARGILVGTIAGGLCPGGPYVSLPILLTLRSAGASIGTLVAFLTAWSLWAVARLPMEIGIMGWKFTAIRVATTFLFPPIAGFLAHVFFKSVQWN